MRRLVAQGTGQLRVSNERPQNAPKGFTGMARQALNVCDGRAGARSGHTHNIIAHQMHSQSSLEVSSPTFDVKVYFFDHLAIWTPALGYFG